MPVSVHDVAPRYFVHCAPVSLEEAVELADGGVCRPLYLHLVVAPWAAGETLADDVVGVIVHRRIGYLDASRERDVLPLWVEAVAIRHEHVGRRAVEVVGRPRPDHVLRCTVIVVAGGVDHLPGGLVHLPVRPRKYVRIGRRRQQQHDNHRSTQHNSPLHPYHPSLGGRENRERVPPLLRERHDRPLGFSKRRRVPTSPPRPPDPRALTTASAAAMSSISSKSLVNAFTTPPLLSPTNTCAAPQTFTMRRCSGGREPCGTRQPRHRGHEATRQRGRRRPKNNKLITVGATFQVNF